MAEPRELTLQVRISSAGMSAIDHNRGGWTRSEYVREALARAVKAKLTGPPTQKAAEF